MLAGRLFALCSIAVLFTPLAGCDTCLEQGRHGVEDPDANEFQLVFNNIVSRDNMLVVDNLDDEWDPVSFLLCAETESITVGNFPVSEKTTIEIHSGLSEGVCNVSACCSGDCNDQTCSGSPVIDTTPFAGGVYVTGLIWRF